MTGRGIDQILPNPGDPSIFERWARSAEDYVRLAEERNGPIPRQVSPTYIWGDALDAIVDRHVEARLINLETAITDHGEPWPGKGINYRMHPDNITCITAAEIDVCALANNHVLDWSRAGLVQTLSTLDSSGIAGAGAGVDHDRAWTPVVTEIGSESRVITLGVGTKSSGIPRSWEAHSRSPGVAMVEIGSPSDLVELADTIGHVKLRGDVVVASVHWGPNWGYTVPPGHRAFAQTLIETGVDVVHGHSSHHPKGIEVHRGKAILYGCGDLINDYEGIRGHDEYRPDLRVVYVLELDDEGMLTELELIAMRARKFSLSCATSEETGWLADTLTRVSEDLRTRIELDASDRLLLRW